MLPHHKGIHLAPIMKIMQYLTIQQRKRQTKQFELKLRDGKALVVVEAIVPKINYTYNKGYLWEICMLQQEAFRCGLSDDFK